jgi:hypothetical protein
MMSRRYIAVRQPPLCGARIPRPGTSPHQDNAKNVAHRQRSLRRGYVAHIPKGLNPQGAAPFVCAGITTYKGIKETQAKPGQRESELLQRLQGLAAQLAIKEKEVEQLMVKPTSKGSGRGESRRTATATAERPTSNEDK